MNTPEETGENRGVTRILLALLLLVPLLPNPGIFTGYDLPKWALLQTGMLAALLVLLFQAVWSKEATRVAMPEHLSLLSVMVIAAFFIAKRAPDGRATILALAQIGMLSAFGIMTVRYLRGGALAERALIFVTIAGAAGALIGIAGWLGAPWTTASTFGNPSFAAEFIAPATLLAVALFLLGKRSLAVLTILPMLVFLVLGKSRADWLGLGCGVVLLFVLELRSRGKLRFSSRALAITILVGIVALPYLIALLPLPVLGRSDTIRVRELARASTLQIGLDHPLTGVGLEGFAAAYPEYRSPEEFVISRRREVLFPHNLPLQVFADAGVPGLLALFFFLYVTIVAGLRTLDQNPEDGIAFGALGAIIAILVSAGFSGPLRHPSSGLLFFLLSALLVGRRPRYFVADLKGRYRRAVPVFILLVPVVTAGYLLGPLLLADQSLKAARDRIGEADGGMDEEVARMLETSIAWRPTVDALRMLAFYRTGTDHPEQALALTERLFELEPNNQFGMLERGRALVATGRAEEALELLNPLVKKRPGDPILNALRLQALMESLKTAPLEDVRKRAAAISRQAPQFVLAMIRMAERIGQTDMLRGLEILQATQGAEAVFFRVVILAANGELSEAMNQLYEADSLGSATPERLRHHPGLDPLRQRADFKSLLKRR